MFLDKALEMFIYPGLIQKYLTAAEINQTIEAFIKSKKYNSINQAQTHIPDF